MSPVRKSQLLLMALLALSGCERPLPEEPAAPDPATVPLALNPLPAELNSQVIALFASYRQQAETDFTNVASQLAQLRTSIDRFLAAPGEINLAQTQQDWLNTHNLYAATQLHRHLAHRLLITSDSSPQAQQLQQLQLEYQLDHWPLLPGYLDGVAGYPDGGLVNDINVALTEAGLRQQHGLFDIDEIALGFHVLEFLLWGENNAQARARSPEVFMPAGGNGASELEVSQQPNNRRRRLLELVNELLMADFTTARQQWSNAVDMAMDNPEPGNAGPLILYQFLEAMISVLNEELLVRSLYPLLNGNYADSIHARYSQSTANAVIAQLTTIEQLMRDGNLYGTPTLDDILVALVPDFGDYFYQNYDASKECLVLLYTDLYAPTTPQQRIQNEFDVVECTNLVSNIIEHLRRVQIRLSTPF